MWAQNETYQPITQNLGQLRNSNNVSASDVKYYTNAGNRQFYFKNQSIAYVLDQRDSTGLDSLWRVDMQFVGANPTPVIQGLNASGSYNYYLDYVNLSNVPFYNNVKYTNLYNGINLLANNQGTAPSYEFSINPAIISPSALQINWTGASSLQLISGVFTINTPLGNHVLGQATASQTIGISKQNVTVSYQLVGQTMSFNFGSYNPTYPISLKIGPVINNPPPPVSGTAFNPSWMTFVEKSAKVTDVYTDNLNNVFAAGQAYQIVVPVVNGAFTNYLGFGDAFLIKFDSYRLNTWGTFFGGSGTDGAVKIAVNNTGYVYLCGNTNSSNIASANATNVPSFPIAASPYASTTTGKNIFIAKFNSVGLLGINIANTFWSYFGHTAEDYVHSMCLLNDDLYITGSVNFYNSGTLTGNVPTKFKSGAYNYACNSSSVFPPYDFTTTQIGFIAKFVPYTSGQNTYLTCDWASAIQGSYMMNDIISAKGAPNSIYVLGQSASKSVATVAASPYSTATTTGSLSGNFILVDPSSTSNVEYIQPQSDQTTTLPCLTEYTLMRFNATGSILWSTMFGGANGEAVSGTGGDTHVGGLTLDKNGYLYICGTTGSTASTPYSVTNAYPPVSYPNFPIRSLAGTGKYNDNTLTIGNATGDGFIARFKPTYELDWCTYFGGDGFDSFRGISSNGGNFVWLCGSVAKTLNTSVAGFPLKNATNYYYQGNFAIDNTLTAPEAQNAFIAQFSLNGNFLYCSYYGNGYSEFGSIANSSDDAHVFIGGYANPSFTQIAWLKDKLGSFDYFSNASNGYGANTGIVGDFYYNSCVGCSRNPAHEATQIISLSNEISVYPNPFDKTIQLDNPNAVHVKQLRWLDVTGKEILQQNIDSEATTLTLDAVAIPKGVVILEVTTDAHTYILKLIKN